MTHTIPSPSWHSLSVAILVLVGNLAHAETNSGPRVPGGTYYEQLDQLRSQNAILKARLDNAELANKINNAGATAAMPPSAAPQATLPINGGYGTSTAQVLMVSGSDNVLTATIGLPTGGTIPARVGTNILGIGKVRSININEVVVEYKGQIYSLPFATETGYGPSGIR